MAVKKSKTEKKDKIEELGEIKPGRASRMIIRHAWVTERASDLANLGQYAFVVDKRANKSEVKKAVEDIYKVGVIGVNIINIKAKKRRLGAHAGKVAGRKKAIVTLKPGQKIDIIPV